uniref:Exosome complex exonuclease RRP40 n=1 Tax=Solanum tuberosum TaxID=4113 RepID=M1DQJ6_SOLTU
MLPLLTPCFCFCKFSCPVFEAVPIATANSYQLSIFLLNHFKSWVRLCLFIPNNFPFTPDNPGILHATTSHDLHLSCIDASGKGAKFGPLKDGYMFESSIDLSRVLLRSPTCPVLQCLRKKVAFQITVGLNGRVWVNGEQKSSIIVVANAIMNS